MKRITCKQCRRLGQSVCGRTNCAIKRKSYRPGHHGKRRTRISEYGRQLMEKQKLKLLYGVRERQFRNYFSAAEQQRGRTGQELISLLERRLDNVVFRLGFAETRRQARQLVSHGHFSVNGRKVTIPSYQVSIGDTIAIRERSVGKKIFGELAITLKNYTPPEWLTLNKDTREGAVAALPSKESTDDVPVEVGHIIEFYSR